MSHKGWFHSKTLATIFQMKQFFTTFPRAIVHCFIPRMLLWHLSAIVLTILLVFSGFD